MKKQIIMTLTLILILLSVTTGCTNNQLALRRVTYTSEANDLIDFMKNVTYENNIANYSLVTTVDIGYERNAILLEYEVFIQDAKMIMEDVIMSFHLENDMINYVKANNVFNTNVFNDHFFNITPNGEIQGASLSRTFILDPSKVDEHMLDLYTTMYAKISYSSENRRIEDYVKLDVTPSTELENYLKTAP